MCETTPANLAARRCARRPKSLRRQIVLVGFALMCASVVRMSQLSRAVADDGPQPASFSQPRQRIDDLADQSTQLRIALQAEPIVPGIRQQAPGPDQAVPQVPAGPPVPPGKPDAFGPGQVRLPLLDSSGKPIGLTPQPSPQVLEKFNQYVERTIDPQNTLDLIQGRPRLLVLKQAPVRIQIADENVASYTLIAETEVSIVGNSIGSTVLNLVVPRSANGCAPDGAQLSGARAARP